MYLRSGGDAFTLQKLLGHSDLAMTRRYCELSQVDALEKHRLCSPGDRFLSAVPRGCCRGRVSWQTKRDPNGSPRARLGRSGRAEGGTGYCANDGREKSACASRGRLREMQRTVGPARAEPDWRWTRYEMKWEVSGHARPWFTGMVEAVS